MIYLDNAATSWPKPPQVAAAITRFMNEVAGNPGRAGHAPSVAAERIVRDLRVKLARLIHAPDPNRIVFCFNGTDALNISIKGAWLQGDHVICTALDHNSVTRPLQSLVDAGGITLTRVSFGPDGQINPADIRAAMQPNTRLVIVLHASNVTGAIQPIADIGRIVRERDGLFLVDAAQSIGVLDLDVEAMNIDVLAAPGHKSLRGPTGTGFLYVGPRADVRPWREGGTGSQSTEPHQPRELPTRLEAGTLNTAGLAGLSAALDMLDARKALEHERALLQIVRDGLAGHPRIRVAGAPPLERSVGVLSLVIDGLPAVDAGAILDQSFGIAVRAGLHCAPFAHAALGTIPDGTIRISPGPATTANEIDAFVSAMLEIATVMKKCP